MKQAIKITQDIIKLDTLNTTLLFRVYGHTLHTAYYGARIPDSDDYSILSRTVFDDASGTTKPYPFEKMPYSSVGTAVDCETLVNIINTDGSRINRFQFVEAKVLRFKPNNGGLPSAHGEESTLEITLADPCANIELKQYYTVYSGQDVITISQSLKNNGQGNIIIDRLYSYQLDLDEVGYTFLSLDGSWCRERNINRHEVSSGTHSIESRCGASSSTHNPFVAVYNEKTKDYYGFNLIYSGNHKSLLNAGSFRMSRFLIGINDYGFSWRLAPGESFATPEAVSVYAKSEQEITTAMHSFVTDCIVSPAFKNKPRPTKFNNWEGTSFNFDKAKILNLADKAKDIGAELFVLDDGWFGVRNDATSGLGDWYDNVGKLGGTLGRLSEEIKSKNLQFGIWVEPEMVNENSDLFKNHPEYAMRIAGREPIRMRNQLVLDLVNPEVLDYVRNAIVDVIKRSNANYVKWDCNRIMTDMFHADLADQGEYIHRYQIALYRLIGDIVNFFPSVLFESCASGGNRYDLGLLCFMPQVWASDNTDPFQRIYIQEGTLFAYPQHTMSAHVTHLRNPAQINTSPDSRFSIASIGIMGYEMDFAHSTQEELAAMKLQSEYYIAHRELLSFGDYYRLGSAFEDNEFGWIVVSKDKSEAIACLTVTKLTHTYPKNRWRMTGLKDDYNYELEIRHHYDAQNSLPIFCASGAVLNNGWLDLGEIFLSTVSRSYPGSMAARLVHIRKK